MKQSTFLKIYIFPSMLISPIFTMSCNSWFSIWMTMEFNLMTFIPMMIFFNNFYKELSMKYFIIQAISSSILIMMSNSLMMTMNFNNYLIKMLIIMINLSLYLKMGAAPFHAWFINMMKNLSWFNCLIISTWQKIIPMMTLMYLIEYKLCYFIIIISSFTGAIMGIKHQSIRLIMAYSSINHMSWMLMNILISEYMWIMYFISYLIINIPIFMIFNKFNIFYINQMMIFNNINMSKMIMLINFISISGLPPMFGFIMKWLTIYFSNWNSLSMIIMMMIILSMFTFIFYMRLCITLMMFFNMKNKLLLIYKFMNLNKMNMLIMTLLSFNLNLWILNTWLF